MSSRNYDNPLVSAAYNHVRRLHRSFDIQCRPVKWDEQGFFWVATQTVWSDLPHLCRTASDNRLGPRAVSDDLSAALIECGVSQSSIHSPRSLPSQYSANECLLFQYPGEHIDTDTKVDCP